MKDSLVVLMVCFQRRQSEPCANITPFVSVNVRLDSMGIKVANRFMEPENVNVSHADMLQQNNFIIFMPLSVIPLLSLPFWIPLYMHYIFCFSNIYISFLFA